MGHPLLAARVTLKRYTACGHVAASPKGEFAGPVDEALEALGRRRDIRVVVPGFPDALRIARHTDLVALVPRSCLGNALGDGDATAGLQHFELPVSVPSFTVAAIWHPRADADPAQRWLRDVVMSLCREGYPSG
jgi:DNA-binding transcriptional LysR family regulator